MAQEYQQLTPHQTDRPPHLPQHQLRPAHQAECSHNGGADAAGCVAQHTLRVRQHMQQITLASTAHNKKRRTAELRQAPYDKLTAA